MKLEDRLKSLESKVKKIKTATSKKIADCNISNGTITFINLKINFQY